MKKKLFSVAILGLAVAATSRAALVITEVDSAGSSNAAYGGDWFELTNTGASALDITGWSIDDNSNASAMAVALHDVTSIAAGQSVVFIEATTTSAYDATLAASEISNFNSAWFGSAVPVGFTIGSYGGSSVGLGSSGDQVNIFNASNTKITGVTFGAASTTATFDNAQGSQTGASNPTIAALSVVGTNGAFTSASSNEAGSPGSATPEPASLGLLGMAGLVLAGRRRA